MQACARTAGPLISIGGFLVVGNEQPWMLKSF
jgi:hypothetical protein